MADWKKNTTHTLDITGYTAEGMGVARLEGRVVFVPFTIQGERWQVRLEKVNKNAAWGRGMQLLVPSPERLVPDCPLYGRCGGCQFRHMAYAEELRAKRQRIADALERVGRINLELPSVLGAEDPLRYRNKVQFPVSQGARGLAVGYYRPRSHDVLDAPDCPLQPLAVTRLRNAFKGWMEQYQIPAYNEKTGQGLIRHLYVRTNQQEESLVCVVANGSHLPYGGALTQALRQAEPGLAGIVLNSNTRNTNVILGSRYTLLWGRDWLEEELCGLTFRLSVPSFFQINHAQTQRLYRLALEFAQLTGTETVLDLYCGIGTISLALARQAGRVIGAELVPQAVEDARENARRNGITNAEFFCGDAGTVAEHLSTEGVRPQVVCVDPPRKGLSPQVPAVLAGMAPDRIVYVSCDPATLARDLASFSQLGYHAVRAQGVDLFPKTAHVETVVCLGRELEQASRHVYLDYEPSPNMKVPHDPTYPEIKAWVLENHDLKVSSLYISQVKRKHGLPVGESYNKPKDERTKQPQCPPEKEAAIEAALRHFGMI